MEVLNQIASFLEIEKKGEWRNNDNKKINNIIITH